MAYFNPRSLAGATRSLLRVIPVTVFQSTLPRGSDVNPGALSMQKLHFNPRSLAGATLISSPLFIPARTFQSTLPRGSDLRRPALPQQYHISIHAPSRERQARLYAYPVLLEFQSTLPRGSDLRRPALPQQYHISIHAPSRERQQLRLRRLVSLYFNPRSLAGATFSSTDVSKMSDNISIHAPSRERPTLSCFH